MNAAFSMHHTSNESYYFCLSTDAFISETRHEIENCMQRGIYFPYFFSTVHISANNIPSILRFCDPVGNVHIEGTVSQNFVLDPSFYFISNIG